MNNRLESGIVPHRDIRNILATVEKPGRYVGGEYGSISTLPVEDDYRVCIVFPDLYEIAMSNQAVRILYKIYNDLPGFHAERAFSPAPDFQQALADADISLYSLENGLAVKDFDMLAVTIGYELSFTNYLSFLKSSGIPLNRKERTGDHPLIIAGGPAMTNPAPWSDYLDGVFIGEAEGHLPEVMEHLKKLKDSGSSRAEMHSFLDSEKSVWTPDNPIAERALWPDFGKETMDPASFPIPSMIPVQDHGVIEIMRGCPNKCRFCHAGVFYRPFRQKSVTRIIREAEYLIDECGYRDITLSSLSTGDYNGLEPLVKALNKRFSHRKVSFSLPSLRVNSVTLSLIGSLGAVRKSGLTFAVETPTTEGQKGINKEVPEDKVIAILQEAKREGWKLAKFYFMLGLPVAENHDEEEAIVDYLQKVQMESGINLNVNLGTFIPKPHTPFERAPQLTDEEAITKIRKIREGLRGNKRIRFSFHSPYVSFLEGILSRGDIQSGHLARNAWEKGAGFDAWDDRMNKDAWREAISECDWDVEQEICRSREGDKILPWSGVSLGVTEAHLSKESSRSISAELTVPCAPVCTDHCGVCDKDCKAVSAETMDLSGLSEPVVTAAEDIKWKRLLLRFGKSGPAVYLGHLDVMGVFEKALQRAGITINFTEGFNPKPRIEFAQPLSLGLESTGEIATLKISDIGVDASVIAERLQNALPHGLDIMEASWIGDVPTGKKVVKVMSGFWGSEWNLLLSEPGISPKGPTLADSITKTCADAGISDDIEIHDIGPVEINLRLRHGGTRHHNLMRILEAAIGKPVLQTPWIVKRTESLSKGKDGKSVSFTAAFPEVYES